MDDTMLLNEAFLEAIGQNGMEKKAQSDIDDFTRTQVREDGFYRKIHTFRTITNDQLDRRLDTDKPYRIEEKEPGSPAAVSLPFGALPTNIVIRGNRYPIGFAQIMTPRHTKNVDELRTYRMDIRQVLSDNAVKNIATEEDTGFLEGVDALLLGPDVTMPYSGLAQWQTVPGGITRDSLQDAFKIMPRAGSRLEVDTVLVNNITIREILKWGRDEIGGDKSQDLLINGWTDTNFARAKWIITIKQDLVPDNSMYMFANEKFVGKAYEMTPPTMYVKREAVWLEFFVYETIGGAIGHSGGVARADFD